MTDLKPLTVQPFIPANDDFMTRAALAALTPAELIRRTTALKPLLAAHAAECERVRHPLVETWNAIRATGDALLMERFADLAEAYGFETGEAEGGETVAAMMRRNLGGDLEEGDRVAAGPVDLIIRRLDDDDEIAEVGLALERRAPPRKLPVFQNWRDIVAYMKARKTRRAAAQAAALAAAVNGIARDDAAEDV